jgi:hypothetical protein
MKGALKKHNFEIFEPRGAMKSLLVGSSLPNFL